MLPAILCAPRCEEELAARKLPVVDEVKRFLRDHRKPDPGADLAQYVSFALSVEGPPDFHTRFNNNEIPPDVTALEGFDALMIRFYRDAQIEQLWQKAQPAIERELERYQPVVSKAVYDVHGYLRNPTSGYMGRHFQVYTDLLGPANQVHTRSYKDDYFLVVSPSPEPQYHQIRHAYLHYLLDPLSIKYAEVLNKKKPLIDIAQGAPALSASYKDDFLLLATESLIKAVEARMAPPAERSGIVSEALAEGFVLTPYFAEALPAYEKQERAMRLYYPDLIAGIDLKKESRRLENVQFAAQPVARVARVEEAPPPQLTGAAKKLAEADGYYAGRELEKARSVYMGVLQSGDRKALPRAYYGLARIAALERNPSLAEELFRKTLEVSPDPLTEAWAELYLGRLAMAQDPPDVKQAAEHFKRAGAIDGASTAVKQAAEQDLNKIAGSQP